jgi:AcrR family transcriptional regulator
MEEIAKGAGISRQGMYRYVSGRETLIELAIIERCREFTVEVDTASAPDDVIDALIDLTLRLMVAARTDPEFGYLAEAMPRVRLNYLLTSAKSPIHDLVGSRFATLLDRAAQQGLLRDDLTRPEMVAWLQGMLTLYVPRADLDISETRRFLEKLALRALLRQCGD